MLILMTGSLYTIMTNWIGIYYNTCQFEMQTIIYVLINKNVETDPTKINIIILGYIRMTLALL